MKENNPLLLDLLADLERVVAANNREHFFIKFYQIRNLHPEKISDDVVVAYKKLLLKSVKQFKKDNSMNTLVSSLISLSYGLIPTDMLDSDLLKILADCVELQDTRIKANALTAICEFDPYSDLFKEHVNSKFNRIAAEALIAEGKQGLNSKIVDKIKSFLGSSNPFFVASGVYVFGQLLEYYHESFQRSENLFQEEFDFFVKKINIFSTHPHEMVRKRALMTKKLIESQPVKKVS